MIYTNTISFPNCHYDYNRDAVVLHALDEFVLCDGCSSAEGSQIGSWIVARSMLIQEHDPHIPMWNAELVATKMLGLPKTALLATVLKGHYEPEYQRYVISIQGDGYVLVRTPRVEGYIKVSYYSGAPYYPYYAVNHEMYYAWSKQFGEQRNTYNSMPLPNPDVSMEFDMDHTVSVYITIDGPTKIVASTDGLGAIYDGNGAYIPEEKIVTHILNTTNMRGNWIGRRLIHFLERNKAKCHDDFTLVGVTNYETI